jgi:DNA-binding transcriptional ArsR family regulator
MMKESIMDIVLQPVRMRILQALVVGGAMTTQQIGESMPEVPQATLYRHLNVLLKAGVVQVLEERQVRGTVEKVYGLPDTWAGRTNQEMLHAPKEDLFKYFLSFLMQLLGEYERYISRDVIDLQKDGLGFRQASVYASDEEFAEFGMAYGEALSRMLQNKPSKMRKLRTIATIIIPGSDK